ncbi:transposase [Klebsiella michiganensis]|nr:transposase [Klebsiella michiganensis]
MQLMLRLSARRFVAHICGLCRLRMRASRQCSVCIVPDRVLSKRKQQHIIVSGGLISEFGVIAPQSTDALRHIVFEQKNSLPLQVQQCVDDLLEHVARIEDNIAEYDRILSRMAKTDHRSQRLMELKGVGPTTACALVASIGNAHDFKNGRQLAAWLGLTPSQYSSGGKSKLGRITKAGDSYLRTLLVQGARSVLIGAEKRTDLFSRWVCSLVERRGYWRAVVAIAAKKMQDCAGHHCITVMISGCTQPAKVQSCMTICSATR